MKAVQMLREKIEISEKSVQRPIQPIENIPTQIKKLAELKEQGILTQEEFDGKKKELLARM